MLVPFLGAWARDLQDVGLLHTREDEFHAMTALESKSPTPYRSINKLT